MSILPFQNRFSCVHLQILFSLGFEGGNQECRGKFAGIYWTPKDVQKARAKKNVLIFQPLNLRTPWPATGASRALTIVSPVFGYRQ